MGLGKDANVAYIIDFGLSKEFRDHRTRQHIPLGKTLGLTGTPAFASIHSHLGFELGRRDDLESLGYVLIYFLRGSLPWQGLNFKHNDHVCKSKQTISISELCKGLPVELQTFLNYSRSLSFNDKPNYEYLRGLFDDALSQAGVEGDFTFDRVGDGNEQQQEFSFDGLKHGNFSEPRTR